MNQSGQEVVPVKISPTELIQRVLRTTDPSKGLTTQVSAGEIAYICRLAHKLFLEQPSLIEIEAPVKICGDVHGQFADLLRLFNKTGFPPSSNYLFLGDYVDRGKHNLETILLLLGYKLRYPKTFFLLRGNHELSSINRVYGFLEECVRRYGTQRVYMDIQDVFTVMPLSAVVGEKILCMHGGLSPVLNRLDDLRNVHRPFDDPPPCSLECDVMWADPMPGVMGFINSPRGTSHVFGEQALKEKCDQLKIDLVVRAHQVVQDGYEFFAGRKLVTIFSAPHYCAQFDNAAAVLCVDKQLKCSFEILKAKFLIPK
ncbi:hypothetical protein PRIPAC_71292 [Pristionchus pacificus]|uniref:Serine/threonine-protein phosphatase n=1 Tax=Pristionchus pacificus TaxID=54126 RepID=A0A2A6BFU0_PRIPA|nr:hypothetical protein PRIPAC_71292 [Pristionchus pacificus]|eukprot:PDM64726.1 Calcineurin-like phosphoesterase [Pristionchus pacificus]